MEEPEVAKHLKQQDGPNIPPAAAVLSDDTIPAFKQGERVIVVGRDPDGSKSYRTATVVMVSKDAFSTIFD